MVPPGWRLSSNAFHAVDVALGRDVAAIMLAMLLLTMPVEMLLEIDTMASTRLVVVVVTAVVVVAAKRE